MSRDDSTVLHIATTDVRELATRGFSAPKTLALGIGVLTLTTVLTIEIWVSQFLKNHN